MAVTQILPQETSTSPMSRFLFRVYSPKLRSPVESSDENDIFFIAPRFNPHFRAVPQNEAPDSLPDPSLSLVEQASYEDVVQYMDWTTRSSSPYISASASFAWAIWEATKRYRQGIKHDIEIAVIDAYALREKAVSSIKLLEKSSADNQHPDHFKWCKYAADSESILIYGFIPVTSVFTSIPLLTVLSNLPPYFHADVPPVPNKVPALDYLLNLVPSKTSYRHFYSSVSSRYRASTAPIRLRDAVIGSLLLAFSLLRPWLECTVMESTEESIEALTELSCSIAQWPDPADDILNGAMTVLNTMARLLLDEMRSNRLKLQAQSEEATRLWSLLKQFEQVVGGYPMSPPSDDEESVISSSSTFVHSTPPSPSLKIIIPSAPLSSSCETTVLSPLELYKTPDTDFPLSANSAVMPPERSETTSDDAIPAVIPMHRIITASDSLPLLSSFNSPSSDLDDMLTDSGYESETPLYLDDTEDPLESCQQDEPPRSASEGESLAGNEWSWIRSVSAPEPVTVSCLVTGFLFGTFIALCVLSNQRRTLITNLT